MDFQAETVSYAKRAAPGRRLWRLSSHPLFLLMCLLISIFCFVSYNQNIDISKSIKAHRSDSSYEHQGVLISYAYVERDSLQRQNMVYFLKAGTLPPQSGQLMEWVFVSATSICEPCAPIIEQGTAKGSIIGIGIIRLYTLGPISLIIRTGNEGMDIGSHNITIQYMSHQRRIQLFRFFIFINSSTRGPFMPPFMPDWWHWTYAFLSRLGGPNNNHAVSSSLVCLPEADAGGPGPRMESWAVALDNEGLNIALAAGVFKIRTCKLCVADEGIVTGGEYGLSKAFLNSTANFTTLMSRYDPRTVWSNKDNWNCNDNVHPSRHGTYGGLSFHPYETVFVKSSWHVGDVYTSRYSKWFLQHLEGDPGTEGYFDEAMYMYSQSNEAKAPNPLSGYYQSITSIVHARP